MPPILASISHLWLFGTALRCRCLLGGHGLTGQCRLLNVEVTRDEKTRICGDQITGTNPIVSPANSLAAISALAAFNRRDSLNEDKAQERETTGISEWWFFRFDVALQCAGL